MAILKPPIATPFATDPTTQADDDLFEAPSFMEQGYTAPGGDPEIPALGHFNWLFWWAMQSGRYHQSVGIPEWDEDETEYTAGATVRDSDGNHYKLIGTATVALNPTADPFNWVPFGVSRRPEYGDGSDGDVTISGTTAVGDRDRCYNNLTIDTTGLLVFEAPFKLRVKGLLWIKSGGVIRFGHQTNLNGAAATGAGSGGAGGIGSNTIANGSVGGGSSGGQGGVNTSGLDTDGLAFRAGKPGVALGLHRFGGFGGAGAAGGNTGGAAGASTLYDPFAIYLLHLAILAGGHGTYRVAGSPPTAGAFLLMGGSGGGGGGGPSSLAPPDNAHDGAGGGAGGSVGIVIANRIVAEANGALYAPGGNGGNSSNYGGGGGGGGGGIGVATEAYAGPTLTAATCCPGGTGGTSGLAQPAGSAGGNGLISVTVL